jgi:hypothetical protein
VTTGTTSIVISVDDHPTHNHGLPTCFSGDDPGAEPSIYYILDNTVTDDAAVMTHSINQDSHNHTATSTLDFGDGSGAGDFHKHSITHGHGVTDTGHTHDTPVLAHTGTLTHRQDDFRPPYYVLAFIQRIAA